MEKLLSIVIPVYKVEKYIDKCISSLLVPDKQQLQLLDIVVINDGTPDTSAILAKAYEKQYPGIVRVIDQENRGHGGAWCLVLKKVVYGSKCRLQHACMPFVIRA